MPLPEKPPALAGGVITRLNRRPQLVSWSWDDELRRAVGRFPCTGMTLRTQSVGRLGERLAEDHLLSLGARLLQRNYHAEYGEIDLLVEHEGDLVAVEVKTRDVEDMVQPEETIRWHQLRRIVHAMSTYAMDNDLLECSWRVDVVLIVIDRDGSVLRLDHLRSVFPG